MKNKKRELYKKIFDKIDEKTGGKLFQRKLTIMGDFEILNFNFFNDELVTKKCCSFHFCECLERKFSAKKGLTDEELAKKKIN